MDPILLDIFIVAVNIYVHGHLELHFNNMYTIQICTWGVIKMHSIIQTLNFTNHGWKITELKICCMLLVFKSTYNKIAYLSYHACTAESLARLLQS